MRDPILEKAIADEQKRQDETIELIASENFVSKEIREAAGSILTNKYAEGYPGRRYYGGCANVDVIETLAEDRACALFGAEHANVQPHSGSQANMAAYSALVDIGSTIMGMDLAAGGHLSHGAKVSFSGKWFQSAVYGVDRDSERLDYDAIRKQALEVRPTILVAGASAYSRSIDFKEFRAIADACGAYLVVDMAHIAGLVAAGLHENPVPYADIVTSTTHKTLRGPRGGLILCRKEYARAVDKAVFPMLQGGPLCHIVAAKAVCFHEALQPTFRTYAGQVIQNAKALAETLRAGGIRLVSAGTDNHLVLADVLNSIGVTGVQAEQALDAVHMTVNKNAIPFDTMKPTVDSGIRLGSAAMTTKGYNEDDFRTIGRLIVRVLTHIQDERVQAEVRKEVADMTKAHPFA